MLEAEDDRSFLGDSAGWLATVFALHGDTDGARRFANLARRISQPDDRGVETLWRRALALVSAQDGSVEAAVRLSDEALELMRDTDWLTARGEALEEASTVRELVGDRAGAEAALAEARAYFERKGNVAGLRRLARR